MGTNLENLNINIRKSPRKCRFFNRGYCKYQDNCSYFHSNTICESYLKNGICDEKACLSRHPRQCRYWSTRAEGCQRENRCQYLHVSSNRFIAAAINMTGNENANQSNNEKSETFVCTHCNLTFDDEDCMQKHIASLHEKSDQLYNTDLSHADITVVTCDKCDFTTDTEHNLQNHTQAIHPYQCDKCKFTAKNKGWITRHMNTCHQIVMATGSTEMHDNEQGPPPPPPCSWFWLGQEGQEQGPFPWFHMARWLNNGLLSANSMLRREDDEDFASLEDIQKMDLSPSTSVIRIRT